MYGQHEMALDREGGGHGGLAFDIFNDQLTVFDVGEVCDVSEGGLTALAITELDGLTQVKSYLAFEFADQAGLFKDAQSIKTARLGFAVKGNAVMGNFAVAILGS